MQAALHAQGLLSHCVKVLWEARDVLLILHAANQIINGPSVTKAMLRAGQPVGQGKDGASLTQRMVEASRCTRLRKAGGVSTPTEAAVQASRDVEQGADGWRPHAIQASAHAGQGVGQEEGQPLSQASEAARDDVRWAACGFEQGWDCSGPPMSQAIQEAKQ